MDSNTVLCAVCGFKQAISENSDDFVCANCGAAYHLTDNDKQIVNLFESKQEIQEIPEVGNGAAGIEDFDRNPDESVRPKILDIGTKQKKLSSLVFISLISAIVIGLIFLFVILFREGQPEESPPIPTSGLANLPKYETGIYSDSNMTVTPSEIPSPGASKTLWPSPIGGTVRPLIINLRSGPGVGFPILQEMENDEPFTMMARNESGTWIRVTTRNGTSGWVSYFSLVNYNFDLSQLPVDQFSIPVSGMSVTPAEQQTTTSTITQESIPSYTPTNTRTLIPTQTKTPTRTTTLTPTRSNTPVQTMTRTPTVSETPSFNPPLPTPLAGEWCEQNTVRQICVYELEYFIESVNDFNGLVEEGYIVLDLAIKNLASFDIIADPNRFTLILPDNNYGFFSGTPETGTEDYEVLGLTTLTPGKIVRGALFISVPDLVPPLALTYRGYIFEGSISIDFPPAQ